MMPIFRSLLTKKIFLLFCFVLAMLLFQFSNAEKVQAYAGTYGGTYTNICGSGYVSCPSAGQLITASCNSLEKCTKNCVPDNASCTSPSSGYTYKFTCSGNHRECGGGGANPIKPADKSKSGLSLGTGGYKCNQTIQLDVFSQDCDPNGTWICASGDLIDYMVWYSGACPLATRTPTPSSTPRASNTPTSTSTPSVTPTPTIDVRGMCKCDFMDITPIAAGQKVTVTAYAKVEGANVGKARVSTLEIYFGAAPANDELRKTKIIG